MIEGTGFHIKPINLNAFNSNVKHPDIPKTLNLPVDLRF